MVLDKDAVIFCMDNSNNELVLKVLTENNYRISKPTKITTLKRNITRIKPILIILDFNDLGNEFYSIMNHISSKTKLSNVILFGDKSDKNLIENLFLINTPFTIIEKPINRLEFVSRLKSIDRKSVVISEMKNNLDDLFTSYNQLEFLTTIIFNDYENDTVVLKNAIKLFLQSQDNYEIHEKAINLLNSIYYNNERFINRFSLLREMDVLTDSDFTNNDLFTIIAPIIEELKTTMTCDFKLAKEFLPNKFNVRGTPKLLKDLFYEVISSLSLPETTLCKVLEIDFRKSNYLVTAGGQKIPSIEIILCSKIEKFTTVSKNEQPINPAFQEYGFGYFFIKEMVDVLNGGILLKDEHKDDMINTTMTIILPESKEKY